MRTLLLIAAILLLVWEPARAESCAAPRDVVLFHVNVVDVERGVVRPDRALVLADGRIETEMPERALADTVAPGASRVDGGGAFVIPGLWDMHVHALWNRDVPAPFFRLFLSAGVTAVRDMGGDLEVALATRSRVAACPTAAPHFWFSGPFLDGPKPVDPSLSIALSTPAEGRAAVKMLKGKGVDFIKVYSLVPPDVFDAVVDEAARQGLAVAGHLPGVVKPAAPSALRMASMEHLAIEIGGLCALEQRASCGPVFQALVRAGVAQTPTLIVRRVSTAISEPDFVEPSAVEGLPDVVKSYWRTEAKAAVRRATNEWRAARRLSLAHGQWMTRELLRLHALLLAGSDAGTPYVVPGESLHDELGWLVEAGLSPAEALRTATVNPARLMHRKDLGVIAPGATADLVLLARNPLEDIRNTRSVIAVYRGGRAVQ
jgi:imidazolonepropionase-like amidohydrolase